MQENKSVCFFLNTVYILSQIFPQTFLYHYQLELLLRKNQAIAPGLDDYTQVDF